MGGKKKNLTDQVVFLLLQVATMQMQIEDSRLKIEHILKRSCQAEAVARSNDPCRTPPSTKRSGEEPKSRSSRPSPATPPTPYILPPPLPPPFPRSTPLSPLSPLQNFTMEEILECLSPTFDLELKLKVLEERARTKRD